jgi:hypothetical protein
MIKGVNKQILEVTNTENPYFEKIIFFIKPQYKNEDSKKLESEAHSLISSAQKPPKIKYTRRQIFKAVMRFCLVLLAGGALSFLIGKFI